MPGVQYEGFVEILERLAGITHFLIGNSPIVIVVGTVRVMGDTTGESFNGLSMLVLGREGNPKVV
jgi:hypothetical protein